MLRHAAWCLLIVVLASVMSSAAEGRRLDVIDGEARVVGTDRKAARVTLVFFDQDPAGAGIATDAEGQFRWQVPAGRVVLAGEDGREGPNCRVMAHDAVRWRWEIVDDNPSRPDEAARRSALEKLQKLAKTRWQVRDGVNRLIVECPAMGDVDVLVRATDGAPVVDHRVRVVPTEMRPEFHSGPYIWFIGRTDVEGRLRMRWSEEMLRLRVVVPGLGFGSTGVLEVVGGQVARSEMPPLARLALVEGTLDPSLAGPGTSVMLQPPVFVNRAWYSARAACDDRGRFAFEDVVPGTYTFSVARAGRPVAVDPGTVQAVPGGHVAGLVIRPPAPIVAEARRPEPEAGPARRPGVGNTGQEVVWAEGTVRDAAGHPVPEVDVFAGTSFHGGIRMYEEILNSTTDAQGHYRIAGKLREVMEPITVIVHAKGMPPVVAYGPRPSTGDANQPPLDLTLAGRGGTLRVKVIRDGKPLPGASVRLGLRGVVLLSSPGYVGRARGPARDRVEELFNPTARSGDDGVAHFRNVFPGTYEVSAIDGPQPLRMGFMIQSANQDQAYGIVDGISVAAGQEVEHAIAVYTQPNQVRLLVLRPEGAPVADQDVSFQFGLDSPPRTSTSLKMDSRGVGTYVFHSPGLWHVDVRFRDTKLTSFPVQEEPYYQARALLPVSPGLALEDPVRMVGVRRGRGSLRVELRDEEGRPARGTIMILGFGFDGPVEHAASTDDQGVVVFADMPAGSYDLRGSIEGERTPFDPGPKGPYPEDDAALRDMTAVARTSAQVDSGAESRVETRAWKVGYVRGTIVPPEGHQADEYLAVPHADRREIGTQWRSDPPTGRFVCGPLKPGTLRLEFRHRESDGTSRDAGTQDVEVPAGDVARVDLRPRETSSPTPAWERQPQATLLGMGGVSVLEASPIATGGTVRLPDGESPAFAARALLFVPGRDDPVLSGVTDAAGRLTWRGNWTSGRPGTRDVGRVEKPTAVVSLPGLSGAVIAEVETGKPIRAVLPVPIAATGRVTFGGRPVGGQNARVRVVAAYRGRSVMDGALGLEATAQATGRFELRGLTAGLYQIQAARDGIWLSRSVELRVRPGEELPDVALDIPDPGATVVVEVMDGRGRPVAGRALTLARPEGPLASLWPKTFRTDSDGKATFRGLEAGDHTLLIDGEPGPRPFRAPEARPDDTRPEIVRLVLEPTP